MADRTQDQLLLGLLRATGAASRCFSITVIPALYISFLIRISLSTPIAISMSTKVAKSDETPDSKDIRRLRSLQILTACQEVQDVKLLEWMNDDGHFSMGEHQ